MKLFSQLVLIIGLVLGATSPGLAWEEPARGTDTRKALMDAIRPHAEWMLGAPVQFVVTSLRRDGVVAFASLTAQRPGGGAIALRDTPAFARGETFQDQDITDIHVLYRKSGNTWVAVHYSFGATDVWWSWGPICRTYRPVTPEVCQGVN
ncbi:MAG: hypothetical protein AAFW87_04225 [Pseudomonadota bacterium]